MKFRPTKKPSRSNSSFSTSFLPFLEHYLIKIIITGQASYEYQAKPDLHLAVRSARLLSERW